MNPTRTAVDAVGGIPYLAKRVGVSQPAVYQWLDGVRKVPVERCTAIERVTEGRVTCEQLRPDVTWARVPDPAWPNPAGRPCIDVAAPKEVA